MRRKLTVPGAAVIGLALAGCAPRANQIAPAIMDPAAYANATCRELGYMADRARRDLIYADMAQDQQYADDRTRTFGVPTAMATLFERGLVGETAQAKADTLVIKAQLERSGCVAFKNTGQSVFAAH